MKPSFEVPIFVVRVDETGSSLTVADGKVEARRRGMSVMVTAGQSLRIDGSAETNEASEVEVLDAPTSEDVVVIEAMKNLFPDHKAESEIAVPKAKPAPVRAKPSAKTIDNPELTLKEARDAWLNGKLDDAKRKATMLLQHPSLSPKLQDDARLLRASILRARGELNEAMVDLEVVASMGREGSRVAAFELGRLAKEQGRLVTAKRA